MAVQRISALALKDKLARKEPLFLLDVREPHEFAYAHIEGSVSIPLSLLPLRRKELNTVHEIVVICHYGMRSQQAANYLDKQGFEKVFNLQGGVAAWATDCDLTMPRY
jgi:rhodanese-related sulfurtransferase